MKINPEELRLKEKIQGTKVCFVSDTRRSSVFHINQMRRLVNGLCRMGVIVLETSVITEDKYKTIIHDYMKIPDIKVVCDIVFPTTTDSVYILAKAVESKIPTVALTLKSHPVEGLIQEASEYGNSGYYFRCFRYSQLRKLCWDICSWIDRVK